MFSEIGSLIKHLNSDSQARKKRNRFLSIFALFIILIILNWFYFNTYYSDAASIRMEQSRLLFLKNLSPYSEDVHSYMINFVKENALNVDLKTVELEIALPQLLLYFPFSFIQNQVWQISIFMSFQGALLVFSLLVLFQMLEIDLDQIQNIIWFIVSLLSMYVITSFIAGGLAIILFSLIIGCMNMLERGKWITAGILIGFLSFDIIHVPLIILMFYFGLFKIKKFVSIFWSLITIALISLFMMIFDRGWIIGWLKNLYMTPQRVPFLTFPNALYEKYNFPPTQLWMVLLLILTVWYVFEIWRNPYNSKYAWCWALAFSGFLNYFVIIQMAEVSLIVLLFTQVFIVALWKDRIAMNKHYIITIALSSNTILISSLYVLIPDLPQENFLHLYSLISSIILILNLYWLRRWAVSPYIYDEILIN